MRPNLYVMLLIFTLSACSGLQKNLYIAPLENVKLSELKVGTPLDVIKKRFWGESNTYTFSSPDGSGKQMSLLQYENEVEEYMNKGPMWILFEDNKLVSYGLGDSRHAELLWYSAYYDYLHENKKMSVSDAERAKYQKLKSLYRLTSYEDEYFTYRIVVAGKLERKAIDGDEANYLIAQKKSELDSKLEAARNNAIAVAQTNELIGLQRASILMQSMQTIQRPVQTSCTTTGFGSTWYTNCY